MDEFLDVMSSEEITEMKARFDAVIDECAQKWVNTMIDNHLI